VNDLRCVRSQDLPKGCLPGTRQGVINEIIEWFSRPMDDNEPRVFWLSGAAGCGKSAIARATSDLFKGQRRCASFFFDSFKLAHEGPDVLFATISHQLAELHEGWKASLIKTPESSSMTPERWTMQAQFNDLMVGPASQLDIFGPILIVIDALDESGSETEREQVLETLKHIIDLPPNFRFFITSRPEADIVNALGYIPWVYRKQLDDLDASLTDEDITRFVRFRLQTMPEIDPLVVDSLTRDIVLRSDQLFQWAATACNYIQEASCMGSDPVKRAEYILSLSSHGGLDGLYLAIVDEECGFEAGNPDHLHFQSIMGRILLLREPMSMDDLFQLWYDEEERDQVPKILSPLGSLLSGVSSQDRKSPVRPLHVSFADFLRSKDYGQKYHINTEEQNKKLTDALFRIMEHSLRFNICNLETSSKRNSEVEDLDARIRENIPTHLGYACCYWADHLSHVQIGSEWTSRLDRFLRTHLLFWLEILSLTKKMDRGIEQLAVLEGWLISQVMFIFRVTSRTWKVKLTRQKKQENTQDLISFVRDAYWFGVNFGRVAEESTPHLYLSALPFIPRSSLLSQTYLPQFPGCLRIHDHHKIVWPRTSSNVDISSSINTSPLPLRARRLSSNSDGRAPSVSTTGSSILKASIKKRHFHHVTSIGYSSDGQYIVSGSVDRTVIVWDAKTGEIAFGPFEGHTRGIKSVAFSPDSQSVASGSDDQTVRIWSLRTPMGNMNPIICQGHTKLVLSVAFSPDGKRIVSGSFDHTLRLWDAVTGELVAGPLQDHTDMVRSVAFSPDGRYIGSGSDDRTVRIWNAQNGEMAAVLPQERSRWVSAVAFSPDSKRIVSGSADCLVRIWDIATRSLVAEPFQGHTRSVSSVEFSPDGHRVVSGSDDGSLIMWDAATGMIVAGPYQGHTELVKSIGFSPDGAQIASGSFDCTVRVWDANAEQDAVRLFQGYIGLLTQDGPPPSPDATRIFFLLSLCLVYI
jgi:WD40 repeat protein